jgi:hypothetical protein
MTYEGMKPMTFEDSAAVAAWVKAGGILVFVDDDKDAFNRVRGWWNSAPYANTATPRQALFAQMGLDPNAAAGTHKVGKGTLIYDSASPAALTYQSDGAEHVRGLVRRACTAARLPYRETNYLALRRGPYVVAAGLDESVPDAPPHELTGRFVNLFVAGLPLLDRVALTPGSRYLLLDLDRVGAKAPALLLAAGKTLDARKLPDSDFAFYAEGPDGTTASVRLRLAGPPKEVRVDDQSLPADAQVWDAASETLLVRFPNAASGHRITVR